MTEPGKTSRRLARFGLVGLALALALALSAAGCGDESDPNGGGGNGGGGNGGGGSPGSGSGDPDCLIDAGEVEAAFGGSAEVLDAPVEGLCTVSVEDVDAGGDGTIEIVFLHGRGGGADEVAELESNCSVNEAEPVDGPGDEACYSERFATLAMVADGELIEVRAFSLLMAANQQVRRAVLELAEVLAPRV